MHADMCACVETNRSRPSSALLGPQVHQSSWLDRGGRSMNLPIPVFPQLVLQTQLLHQFFFYMGAGGSIQAFYGLSHLPSPRTLLSAYQRDWNSKIPCKLSTSWQCLLNSLNLVL